MSIDFKFLGKIANCMPHTMMCSTLGLPFHIYVRLSGGEEVIGKTLSSMTLNVPSVYLNRIVTLCYSFERYIGWLILKWKPWIGKMYIWILLTRIASLLNSLNTKKSLQMTDFNYQRWYRIDIKVKQGCRHLK